MHGKPMKCTTVLFDFDDTLVDSWLPRTAALQRVFDASAIQAPTAGEVLLGIKGGPLEHELARMESDLGRELDLYEQYRRIYWLKEPGQLRLYPGIQALLDRLATAEAKLGIVTAKRRSFEILGRQAGAEHEMRELNITDRFHVVVGFEDVNNPKPHPETIDLALSHLGIRPDEALVVGDSAADIAAAQAAGCRSCWATWGIPQGHMGLNGSTPDLVASGPEVVSQFLGLESSGP